MIYTAIIWVIAALILLKSTKFIGRFLRYSFSIFAAVMCLCLIRFLFLPGAIDALSNLLEPFSSQSKPNMKGMFPNIKISLNYIPVLVFSTLGPGWGSILTMASFNDFKTNIYNFSWLMCLGQLGVITGMGLIGIILTHFLRRIGHGISRNIIFFEEWSEFLRIPTSLTFMELPNLWSLLFFGMFVLGSLNLLVIQLHSLFTSIFDEFENLREMKRHFVLGTVVVLGFISMFFCSNHGMYLFDILSKFSIMIQAILNLFLLLVVLWVYGRERFQRDLKFMTSQVYSTWMVYVVRFVAPIVLYFGFCTTLEWSGILFIIGFSGKPLTWLVVLISCGALSLLTFCVIPSYCIFKRTQTTGSICVRLRKSIRPIDWYPADTIHKENYERLSRTDSSRPLTV